MASDVTSSNAGPNPDPGADEPDLDEWWSWGNFARLFIFPLIIVAVAVVIYGLFQFMLRDRRTVQDYIRGIETGSESQRWRMAYSLAQEVRRHDREREFTTRSAQQVVRLYRTAEDPRIRQYLAHVLAALPIPSAVEALEEGLEAEEPGVRVNTALALGRLGERVESDRLRERLRETIPKLTERLDDPVSEVRRMAAFVLGSLGDPRAIEPLKRTLNDSAEDVRWNGAIALGRLGDDAGGDVLLEVVRKGAREDLGNLEPSVRQNLLVNAIRALRTLEVPAARSSLETLSREDEDPEVRTAARKALEVVSGGNASPS